MNADLIFIQGLLVKAIIGIEAWEQQIRQDIILDLEIKVDIAAAGKSGDLAETVDYCALAQRITAIVEAGRFGLLETLADQVAALVLAWPLVQGLRLRVAKPFIVPNAKQVGVVVVRGDFYTHRA